MKTSIVVAIISAFALVAPTQASTKVRGVVAMEEETHRTLKMGSKGGKGDSKASKGKGKKGGD
jgi:hypothetical protein